MFAQQGDLGTDLAGITVLVVDDDFDARRLWMEALRLGGATVAVADSAAAALNILAQGVPDVIVTDIAMPGGDGYFLLDTVRRLPRKRPVRVAALTGRDVRDDPRLNAFDRILQKPIDPFDVCTIVRELAASP